MARSKLAEVVGKIVDLLSPLTTEERGRVIAAARTLLGDPRTGGDDSGDEGDDDETASAITTTGKAKSWQRQNGVTADDLSQVFHVADGVAEVILGEMPGKNKREQTLNAYVLAGLARFIVGGEPQFTDKDARKLCNDAGCYDATNHAKTLKARGNWFTGSKVKGWVLTAPGLKHAATLFKPSAPAKG